MGLLALARQEEEEMIFLSSLQKIRRETQTVNVELFNTRNQNFSEKTLHWFHSVAVITSALHAEGTTYSMVPQVAACVGCKKFFFFCQSLNLMPVTLKPDSQDLLVQCKL